MPAPSCGGLSACVSMLHRSRSVEPRANREPRLFVMKTPSLAGCVLAMSLAMPIHAEWLQTWGAAPLPPTPAMGPFPASPALSDQTVRQFVRVSAGGKRIRLRLTNEFGSKPLRVGAVRVALADDKGAARPGTGHPVRFAGETSVVIAPGAPSLSDPVDLPVAAPSSLSI